MRPSRALLAAAVLLAGCLGGDPYRRLAKELSAPLGPAKVRIAVLPFRGLDSALNAEGEAIAERLLPHLYGRRGVELIERSRLQQVMSETALGATGALDGATATALGRLVGARALVVGTVSRAPKGLELSARVVEVETGKLLAAGRANLPEGRNVVQASGVTRLTLPALAPTVATPTPAKPLPVPGKDLGPGLRTPSPIGAFGAAAIGRRIYVVGGVAGAGKAPGHGDAEVISSLVGPDGALGRWRSETPLPEARYQVGAASWRGRLFAVGGYEGSPRSEVFAAKTGDDGLLQGWTVVGRLPRACTNPGTAAAGGRLFVAGCSAIEGIDDSIYSAPIGEDGRLGEWEAVRFPHPLANCSLAVDGRRLLIVGGAIRSHEYSAAVYALPVRRGPDAGGVSRVGLAPVGAAGGAAGVAGGRLWILGGYTNAGVWGAPNFYRNVFESAPLTPDGGLGPWRTSALRLNPVASNPYAPYVGGAFYLLGGSTQSGRSDVVQRFPAE